MAYLASFDLAQIGASTLLLSTSGHADIGVDLSSFAYPNVYSEAFTTPCTVFNHVVAGDWPGFGPDPDERPLQSFPGDSLLDALGSRFQALATTATWSSPSSLVITLNPATWRITFAYANSFTAIAFGNTETRRIFGFSGDFSGSSASVTGGELPKYIIVPEVDGASSATPVIEEGAISSAAYISCVMCAAFV